MIQIDLKKIDWSFKNDTITISEKDTRFGTEYLVISPKGNGKVFKFSHSTGPEFDKNTKWIYTSEDNIQLAVCNDANMVKHAAKEYLSAKLRR